MQKILPFLKWLPHYKGYFFLKDLVAGLTVGIILIPQGMAYALIAGLPPVYGLYASLIPVFVYALLGTSRKLAVGPVAMDSLLIAAGLGTLAISGVDNYIAMALLLTFMVGAIQLIFGIFRMGFLVNFLSKPVLSGFTSGAVVIIMVGQLNHLLGVSIVNSNKFYEVLSATLIAIPHTHWITVLLGGLSVLVILVLKKWNGKIPGVLIVVILTIVITFLFQLDSKGVGIVGDIPIGLPNLTFPEFSWTHSSNLFAMAITLALIGYMEAISIGKALEEKTKEETIDANQELIALGSANIIGSFFQGFPITASMSRSAVNNESGAQTPIAAVISVLLVMLTLLFFTPLFYYLPNAVLAAIIMVSVFGLIDLKYPNYLWKHNKDEFFLLLVTFLMTLFLGIKEGILFGMLFSLLLMVYRTSKPHFAILGKIKGSDYYRNIKRFEEDIEIREDLLVVRFDSQLYFGNINYFKKQMRQFINLKGPQLKGIILNAEAINYIDSTAIGMLSNLIREIHDKNIAFFIAGATGPARDIIFSSPIISELKKEYLFTGTKEAVAYFDNPASQSLLSEKLAYQNMGNGN